MNGGLYSAGDSDMFKVLIEELLGKWGTKVLEFVLEYKNILSTVVVAAGFVMIYRKYRNKTAKTEKQSSEEESNERN